MIDATHTHTYIYMCIDIYTYIHIHVHTVKIITEQFNHYIIVSIIIFP